MGQQNPNINSEGEKKTKNNVKTAKNNTPNKRKVTM